MTPFRRSRPMPRPLPCGHVGRLLQSYLDGEMDQATARLVAEHLEDCRRCGLEASVYTEIRSSLARHEPAIPSAALERLRQFGEQLAAGRGPGAA